MMSQKAEEIKAKCLSKLNATAVGIDDIEETVEQQSLTVIYTRLILISTAAHTEIVWLSHALSFNASNYFELFF